MYLIKQEPQRIILGEGVRYKRRKGAMQLTQVNEEAYYIPLLDSLQQLLNDEFIFGEVKKVNTIIYLHHFLILIDHLSTLYSSYFRNNLTIFTSLTIVV